MTQYIQFTDQDGSKLLIETDETEVFSEEGIVKAGLNEVTGKVVTSAQTLIEKAVGEAISVNVRALLQSVRNLATQDQPESMEVSFALKATGEVGNVAVARGSAEANYTVTLTWKR